ncbi:MAG: DNA polymerase Y family protein [Terriglobales bacterium]
MPFACIFVPDFPVEALLRAEPALRSQPLAVLEGKHPLQKVFAANENARRAGVVSGMTKLQIEPCAGLAFRARSVLQETAAHAALLDCAQSFSPRVEDAAPGAIVLDLLGMELLFGALPKIAQAITRRAMDLGLTANVAVAANPDTAVLAASGFRGVTVIPKGKEAERLGNLPVQLALAGEQEPGPLLETFHRWGIRNLRDLAALPDVPLSERLGQHGVYLQKLARGETSRTLVPVDPPLVFEEAIELEYPLTLLEPLAFLLNQLLDHLCSRLATRALATQELRLELELADGYRDEDGVGKGAASAGAARPGQAQPRRRFQRTLHLPLPLLDSKIFLKLIQLDLQTHPPGAPIVRIHIAAEPVRPRPGQTGLFLPPSPEPEKLELTLARIAAIVGEEKIGSLEILDTHRPQGFRMQRFAPNNSLSSVPPCMRGELLNCSADPVTALRIFRPPAAATVTMHEGRPTFISCLRRKQTRGEILWAAGPWRSSGDWWEQEGWARDEWDIAVGEEAGIGLYRLVRDLLAGQWLLEGTYD